MWARIIGGVAVLAIIAVLAITFAPLPVVEGDVKADARNDKVYAALAANGITDAAVDVTSERVLVTVQAPDNVDAYQIKYVAFGAAAALENAPPLVVVEVFRGSQLLEAAQVRTDLVVKFLSDGMSFEDFEKNIQKL
jgi:hypothetical protein